MTHINMESRGEKKIPDAVVQYPQIDINKEIPDGVKDKDAWYEWVKLNENTLKKDTFRLVETSDPDLTVDLCTPYPALRKQTKHLPQQERDTIERKAKAVKIILGKLSSLKNQAFGIKQKGIYSAHENILDPRLGEIIEYFGRFYSVDEVHKIVVHDWGYPVAKTTVERFRKRHIDKIKERQEEYKRDYSDIRLGYKKSRLEELEYLYNDRKLKYKATQSRDDYKLLLQTIEQIKKEVEVDVLRIEGDINHKVEMTLNTHIIGEIFKEMTINDIIIGRIASRQGISSANLIEKLHNSFYAKHSGFQTTDRSMLEETPIYPSTLVYNWGIIEKLHKEKPKQSPNIEEAKIVEENQTNSQNTNLIKQSLLARIKVKQGDINESSSKI